MNDLTFFINLLIGSIFFIFFILIFGTLFLLIIIGVVRKILFNLNKLNKYKFINSPLEMTDTNTPYVISGKIYSYEENLISPASLNSCIYYSYSTRAYKGFHSSKLYFISQDNKKLELHSNYNVEEFPFIKYNNRNFPVYFVNLNSYLQKSDFKLPKFFSSVSKDTLEEQVAIDEKYKNSSTLDRLKSTNTRKNVPDLIKGFYKSFKPIFNEDYYAKEHNNDLDNDQFLLRNEGTEYDYLSKLDFLDDEISENCIMPGQDVTIVCYTDKNNNYAVGSYKYFELITIYPGINFDPRKTLLKKTMQDVLVLFALLGLITMSIFVIKYGN